MKPLICKCCGGTINRETMICPYCDTAYTKDEPETISVYDGFGKKLCELPSSTTAIMTPNEMREKMGLEVYKDVLSTELLQLHHNKVIEELYNSALTALRDYNSNY